ncbi:MAG: imidazole glycerol phosphate synthase subunit HisH [Candidatus Sericytochromatia bacterium]
MSLNQKILIIDYDIGNISSILNSINFLGYKNIKVSSSHKDINDADLLILPGVGAFKEAIKNIKKRHLDQILNEVVITNKKPILGICVGMQLISEGSEEGGWNDGLGWIKGKVKKFNLKDLFIPHVGWNDLRILSQNSIFSRLNENPDFYFDHSYYFETESLYVTSYCKYGIEFASSVQKDNIFGVQFHPEKSYKNGLKVFRNFFNIVE